MVPEEEEENEVLVEVARIGAEGRTSSDVSGSVSGHRSVLLATTGGCPWCQLGQRSLMRRGRTVMPTHDRDVRVCMFSQIFQPRRYIIECCRQSIKAKDQLTSRREGENETCSLDRVVTSNTRREPEDPRK